MGVAGDPGGATGPRGAAVGSVEGCWCAGLPRPCHACRERAAKSWYNARRRARAKGLLPPVKRRWQAPPARDHRRRPKPVLERPARRRGLWLCCSCLRYQDMPMVCRRCRERPIRGRVRFGPQLRDWAHARRWGLAELGSIMGGTTAVTSYRWQGKLLVHLERVRSLARAADMTLRGLLRATGGKLVCR